MRRHWADGFRNTNPFEVAVLLIAIARGLSYTTGFLPASAAERTLPKWLLYTCLSELTLGAAITLGAALAVYLPLKRAGLWMITPSAFAYGVILEVNHPHASFLSFIIYCSIGAAAQGRLWQLAKIQKTVDYAASVVRDERS